MTAQKGQLVVVIAPETAEEASRHFSALLAGGYHPVMDYGPADAPMANFPVMVPQTELVEAQAYLKGVRASRLHPAAAPAPKAPSMFGLGLSDRPTGPLPPWTFRGNVGKALGVLGALAALGAAIVALVLVLQFLGKLTGH